MTETATQREAETQTQSERDKDRDRLTETETQRQRERKKKKIDGKEKKKRENSFILAYYSILPVMLLPFVSPLTAVDRLYLVELAEENESLSVIKEI